MRLGTQQVNAQGHLAIGGCDALALAAAYGTPLYVLDEDALRTRCRDYKDAFAPLKPDVQIAYAAKAALNRALCQIVAEEGLGLDVASGGELYTALQAGFPPAHIHLHGVYKTDAELQMALQAGVGAIVLDNFEEMARLSRLATDEVSVMLRIAPEVDADTHPLIRTGQRDSKFGFHLLNGDALRAVEQVLGEARFRLLGFHCHIGSQISDLGAFAAAAHAMVAFADAVRQRYGYTAPLLNIGGGLAVRYTPDDPAVCIRAYAETLVGALREACQQRDYPEPALGIEPGRSLIAEAGITLYRVGAVKHIPHGNPNLPREYLIVDGGVSDNPRPQMYGARYTAVHVNRADEPHTHPYRIMGKHCETDPIIDCALLPETRAGDVIAVLTTGAYAYSMSSQYNRYPRPAMVAVSKGAARVIVERETYADVARMDSVAPQIGEGRYNTAAMSVKRLSRREFLQQAAATTAMAVLAPHALAISTHRRVSTMAEIQVVEYTAKPLPEKVFQTEKFGISRKTHEEHYKLYQGYVNKTNEIRRALAQLTAEDFGKGNQTYSLIRSLKVDYTFAIGGVKNHELYFENIGGGSEPSSELRAALTKAFGSYERWAEDFKATGMGGRGWVWLAYDHDEGIVFNYIGDAQNTFPVWHNTVLLAMDVYEHAYYLDFQTARARYIDAFIQAIDWEVVNRRYEAALRMQRG